MDLVEIMEEDAAKEGRTLTRNERLHLRFLPFSLLAGAGAGIISFFWIWHYCVQDAGFLLGFLLGWIPAALFAWIVGRGIAAFFPYAVIVGGGLVVLLAVLIFLSTQGIL